MSAWASVGASQRNLSIHEKCRVSQTQPDRPFGDNRCLIWLQTGPGYRATVVCSLRLQGWRYFLTKFLCHAACSCRYEKKHGKFFCPSTNETLWEDTDATAKVLTIILISISVCEPQQKLKRKLKTPRLPSL